MSKKKVPGLAKAFAGYPHSFVLDADEQGVVAARRGNELTLAQSRELRRGNAAAANSSLQAFVELQQIRAASQQGAQAQQMTAQATFRSNELLEDVNHTLGEGFTALESGVGQVNSSVRQMGGLPSENASIVQLCRQGAVDESEAIVLAIGGALNREQTNLLLGDMEPWKRDILESNILGRTSRRIEGLLSRREKDFLKKIRKKAGAHPSSFSSISALARHQILDSEVQNGLAVNVRGARTGTQGVIHAAHEIADQNDQLIAQGAQLHLDNKAAYGVQAATLGATKGIQRSTAAIDDNTRGIKRDTANIARGIAAQLYLTHRGNRHLSKIEDASVGTERNTAGIQRNTALLKEFAREGLATARANLATNLRSAEGIERIDSGISSLNATAVEQVHVARAQHQAMVDVACGIDGLLDQGDIANSHLSELVGFAERMDLIGQMTLQASLDGNETLSSIDERMAVSNDIAAAINAGIANLHGTIIQGFGSMIEIGLNQTAVAERTNEILLALGDLMQRQHVALLDALSHLNQEMERRHQTDNQARAKERFDEGYKLYQRGEIGDALEVLDLSIGSSRLDPRPYFLKGLCFVNKERPDKAEKAFKKALRILKDNPKFESVILLNLARLYYSLHRHLKDPVEAEEKLIKSLETAKKALECQPSSDEAKFALALYLAADHEYQKAVDLLLEVIPRNPQFIARMIFHTEFDPICGSFKDAIAAFFDQGNEEQSLRTKVNIGAMKDCLLMGDIDQALVIFKFMVQYNPADLFRAKPWEVAEFRPLRDRISNVFMERMQSDPTISLDGYALIFLVFKFREDQPEFSDLRMVEYFFRVLKNDPDSNVHSRVRLLAKLNALSPEFTEHLLRLNRLHTDGVDWLCQ